MRRFLPLLLVVLAACGAGAPNLANAPTGGDQVRTGTISPSAEHETEEASPTTHCGYERWNVKTGQDLASSTVDMTPKSSSVAALSLIPEPAVMKGPYKYPPQVKRLPAETKTYTIHVTVIAYRSENDSDIHLVVSDGQKHTMITEIPNPACLSNLAGAKNDGPSPWVSQITAARNAFLARTGYKPVAWQSGKTPPPFVKANLKATLTGVAFYDFPHNQYGAAKTNAIELHPLLAVSFP